MKLRLMRFNNYLCCLLLLVLVAGCESSKEKKQKKEASTLRLHLEVDREDTSNTAVVPVYRGSPTAVKIQKQPFLSEGEVVRAAVVDVVGGYSIQVSFTFRGRLTLESVTAGNRGRRIAIFSTFSESRWLAAPKVTSKISDGVLTFTPDATREEAERIVRGLNNIAKELGNKATD